MHYIICYCFCLLTCCRFIVGTCFALDFKFKIRARAQFLTPSITYTVNLVFKFYNERNLTRQPNILLKYKVRGQTKTSSFSYLAVKRDDDWWMVELCHFTSQGTIADFEIIFEDNHPYIVVDGIEFLPVEELEKVIDHFIYICLNYIWSINQLTLET